MVDRLGRGRRRGSGCAGTGDTSSPTSTSTEPCQPSSPLRAARERVVVGEQHEVEVVGARRGGDLRHGSGAVRVERVAVDDSGQVVRRRRLGHVRSVTRTRNHHVRIRARMAGSPVRESAGLRGGGRNQGSQRIRRRVRIRAAVRRDPPRRRSPRASSPPARTRRRMPATPTGSATTACRPAAAPPRTRPGRARSRYPAKYDGYDRAAGEGARRHPRARRGPGRQHRARRRHLGARTTPAPAGGYPLIVFMHGCCAGSKTSWEGNELRHRGGAVALQQRLVRLARVRGGQLHVARISQRREQRQPRLDRRDAARLAPLRDQRLPAPRGPGRGRPVLQREPAEGGRHRRLVRRRVLLAGAHGPDLGQPRRARR